MTTQGRAPKLTVRLLVKEPPNLGGVRHGHGRGSREVHSVVEGTHQGPMVRLWSSVGWVDPRRFRLYRVPADYRADRQRIRRAGVRVGCVADRYLVAAARRILWRSAR